MITLKTQLTLEEFLTLPETDLNTDNLLEGLQLTPKQLFQQAGII